MLIFERTRLMSEHVIVSEMWRRICKSIFMIIIFNPSSALAIQSKPTPPDDCISIHGVGTLKKSELWAVCLVNLTRYLPWPWSIMITNSFAIIWHGSIPAQFLSERRSDFWSPTSPSWHLLTRCVYRCLYTALGIFEPDTLIGFVFSYTLPTQRTMIYRDESSTSLCDTSPRPQMILWSTPLNTTWFPGSTGILNGGSYEHIYCIPSRTIILLHDTGTHNLLYGAALVMLLTFRKVSHK